MSSRMGSTTPCRSIRLSGSHRRFYALKTSNMFLPNELKYEFEGERLTPEENRRAIPKRPEVKNVNKYFHEIIRPDQVADLVGRPQINEVFVTALAKDSPYSGDERYRMVPKDEEMAPEAVNLYFTSLVTQWIDAFNAEVQELADVESIRDDLHYTNRAVRETIDEKYKPRINSDFFEESNLLRFFKSFGVYKSDNDLSTGTLFNSRSPTISFENIAQYLLSTKELVDNPEHFDLFLKFIARESEGRSVAVWKDLMTAIIHNLYDSKVSTVEAKLTSFEDFMTYSNLRDFHIIWSSLSPSVLDRAAYLLSMSSRLTLAKDLLKLMIKEFKVSPSTNTLDSFMLHYEKSLDSSITKETVLRQLSDLKPAIFHNGLSHIVFKIILKHTVENTFDLNQLLNLAENGTNNILAHSSPQVIDKLIQILSNSSDSDLIKSVYMTSVIARMIQKNKIVLDSDSVKKLANLYDKLGFKENVNYFKSQV